MLQTIRDRFTGPITWVVIALIAVPFAFWGVQSFSPDGADPTVAKVGGVKITSAQVQAAYDQRLGRLQQMMGESFRSDMIDPVKFREGVVNEMVQETALRQHSTDVGYAAGDAAVLNSLQAIPAFQKDGKFSAETYRATLAGQGYTTDRFERQLREGLAVDQVRDSVLASAFVTPAESAAAWRLAKQERSWSQVLMKTADYEAAVEITEADIKQHYTSNSGRYQAPERVKLQYLELALDALPEAPAPEAAALKAVYDTDVNKFSSPEERRASHILVNFGADKSASKKKAGELRAKLVAGADFAALAKELSDDPGSKPLGGDLGWVKRGAMTPKFEQALFALDKPGALSEAVETEFGWHLIKLGEVKAAMVKPFEDASVQAELLTSYRQRDAEKRYQDMAEKLEQVAFENASSLEPAAKALGLPLQSSDWLGRSGGSGLFGNPDVLKAAFAPEVIKDGENSKPIPAGDNRQLVLRKTEYEAPHLRKLEEVAEEIRTELRNQRARAKALADAEALIQAAKAEGAVFENLLKERALIASSASNLKRDDSTADPAVLKAAFKLPRPLPGKLSIGKSVLANGDVAVIALGNVRDAEPTTGDAAFEQEGNKLRDGLAGAEFAGFRTALEKKLGVSRKPISATDNAAEATAETGDSPK